jgi:hypothetical protein
MSSPTPLTTATTHLELLAMTHKTYSTSTLVYRLSLAKVVLAALAADEWSRAGSWLDASAEVEKLTPDQRLTSLSMLRFVMGSSVKGFLDGFISFAEGKKAPAIGQRVSVGMAAPGVTIELCTGDADAVHQAKEQDDIRAAPGTATIVLGVGNQPFLALIDVLSRVFTYSECVLLKHHPLRQYLISPYTAILKPLITAGIVRMIPDTGVPDIVELLKNPLVGHVHITGSENTAAAINKTLLSNPTKPRLTSELGCSTPWIVYPSVYSSVELHNAARTVAFMKKLNGGSNCLDAQVVVVSSSWQQKDEFLELVKHYATSLPTTKCYYPGVHKTYANMKEHYEKTDSILLAGKTEDEVTIVNCGTYPDNFDNYSTINEAFCPILSWVQVTGGVQEMIAFCNSEEICGSLSCTVLSAATAAESGVEEMLHGLKYGTVANNVANNLGYITMCVGGLWGAYPTENRSGVGIVGNQFRVEGACKQIIRASPLAVLKTDMTQSIPPLLADVLHKAVNGNSGVVMTLLKVNWMLVRRTGFWASSFVLGEEGRRRPGSAVVVKGNGEKKGEADEVAAQ